MDKRKIIKILIFVGLFICSFLYFKNTNLNFDKDNWKWNDNWNGKGPIKKIEPAGSVENLMPKDEIGIVANNYSEALFKSEKTGKPILVFYTAEWCSYCKKMKSETLPTQEVSQALKKYILVYVNTDIDRSGLNKFGVKSLPSFIITNSKEEKLKSSTGFMDKNSFVEWLNSYNK